LANARYFVVPDVPGVADVDPVDPLEVPVDDGGLADELPDMLDEPVDPLFEPLVLLPLECPAIGVAPERFAFSRAMHASRSLAGTFWQIIVGSSARFAGTRSPVVPDVVPAGVAPVLPLVPPAVPAVCALAAAAVPSAIASAKVFSCIMVMPSLLVWMNQRHAKRDPGASMPRQHAPPVTIPL
jgi:hypothetical protein